MSVSSTTSRPFKVGTPGWSASDLDDPVIERQWFAGRYELVEGVLTEMPAAYFAGGNAVANVLVQVSAYSKAHRLKWRFATEADIVIDQARVVVADLAMLTPADSKRQTEAMKSAGKSDPRRVRILAPPTLIVESVSPGHELHDRRTKFRWYAEFGVPNYWIVDAYTKSFDCFRLEQGAYALDATGKSVQTLEPSAFEGLQLNLREIWEDD